MHVALWLVALFASLFATVAVADDNATADDALRVMSFNIRYANRGDGANAWPHRRAMVAGILRSHRVDTAGLQEALQLQVAQLAEDLPEFGWMGVGRDDGRNAGEFSPIFYRKDRLEPLDSGNFWLSATPETAGSKGWDAALPRIVTWALFRDKQTDKRFYHFNTHFDHLGHKARDESAKLILRRMAQRAQADVPLLLTGDLNVREDSFAYRLLTGKEGDRGDAFRLQDALAVSETPPSGPNTTFNGFDRPSPGEKIDFILFAGPVRVLDHRVLDAMQDGRYPSDHFPILAELILQSP